MYSDTNLPEAEASSESVIREDVVSETSEVSEILLVAGA